MMVHRYYRTAPLKNLFKFEEKNQKNLKFIFTTLKVFIYPTYFLKLYLDPNYGDRSTVFTDKIQTQLAPNSRPGNIDPYVLL